MASAGGAADQPAAGARAGAGEAQDSRRWLQLFHSGDRATMEACYREHFATVERAIGTLLRPADRETVIHELFSQLLARPELRRAFEGGTFATWLAAVARNRAIDAARRLGREVAPVAADAAVSPTHWAAAADARLLIDRFRERIPPDWDGVFEARFLLRLPQREAARRLSLHRTTLAYREMRLRRQLKQFLLEEDGS